MKNLFIICLTVGLWNCSPSDKKTSSEEQSENKPAVNQEAVSAKPGVFFKNLTDGDTLNSPIAIEMGVTGMQVEPAGQVKEGFGHHHILINQTSWPAGTVIPMSDTTKHFGKGQIETNLELTPGVYTIALQFANGVHSSYGESMATAIQVVVE
jgi:hypothetical protein